MYNITANLAHKEDRTLQTKRSKYLPALAAAFPYTLPIFAGFWFLGLTYGIYMNVSGFSFWYPMLMSLTIFAGSVEFVTVNLLMGSFNPLQALVMTLMINARHLFYGLSMLDKFKGLGAKRFYLIFGMCDETFSINCTVEPPAGVDTDWFRFFVTGLNHLYWVASTALGAFLGAYVHFDTTGIEFVMTALFVVLFLGQWERREARRSAVTGLGCALLALVIFGGSQFIIPAMILITWSLLWKKKFYMPKEEQP